MKTVKLESLSEVKTAKDNRQYYTAEFSNPANPFGRTVSRNFWQQKNAAGEPVWRGADPAKVKAFVGKTIPGSICAEKVEEYTIEITGQEPRPASTYTTVVLDGELKAAVFANLGHKLAEEATVEAPAVAEEEAVIM